MIKNSLLFPFSPLILLSIPFIAMQFSESVQWSLFDFILMGTLLTAVGFGTLWAVNSSKSKRKQRALIFLIFFVFHMLWVELSVGIFNSHIAGN